MNEIRKLMEAIERIEKDNGEYSRCTWCKGGGREWDPYATYEGGAWKDCEACNGTGDANKFVAEEQLDDEPCSICKGQGRPWDPYATYEGGAYRDCEACRGTGSEDVRLAGPEDELDEASLSSGKEDTE